MAASVGIRAARASFSELLERARNGETISVTRRGREIARIVPPATRSGRKGGWYKGELHIPPDFDETPQEIIDLFEGGDSDP